MKNLIGIVFILGSLFISSTAFASVDESYDVFIPCTIVNEVQYDSNIKIDDINFAMPYSTRDSVSIYNANFINFSRSAGTVGCRNVSLGRSNTCFIDYAHIARTNTNVIVKLVNVSNGASSQSISVSPGTLGAVKSTTLKWEQVPDGNWEAQFQLQTPTTLSNAWELRGYLYNN